VSFYIIQTDGNKSKTQETKVGKTFYETFVKLAFCCQ